MAALPIQSMESAIAPSISKTLHNASLAGGAKAILISNYIHCLSGLSGESSISLCIPAVSSAVQQKEYQQITSRRIEAT